MKNLRLSTAGTLAALGLMLIGSGLSSDAQAQGGGYWKTRVVASGLDHPRGIVAESPSSLYFTEVPTPGTGGSSGGMNVVKSLRLRTGRIDVVSQGEPEPVNLALDRWDNLFWTCKSAGVILRRDRHGAISPYLTGLSEPNGIAADRNGEILFTEIPTPGVNGNDGGLNAVSATDGTHTTFISIGEPEPSDIAISPDATVYWTCRSAGVILKRSPAGVITLLRGGLDHPMGIALDRAGRKLYFTEVPTPGVAGGDGGSNRVSCIHLESGSLEVINEGDPEPSDITVAGNGHVFWTCTSAGVIVEARRSGRGGSD